MKDEEIINKIEREFMFYHIGDKLIDSWIDKFNERIHIASIKAKSQTIQQVRDVLETKLNYWNNLLKNKSNHSLSDEIDIQQMRAKVEIIEELLSQLEEIKGEVKK